MESYLLNLILLGMIQTSSSAPTQMKNLSHPLQASEIRLSFPKCTYTASPAINAPTTLLPKRGYWYGCSIKLCAEIEKNRSAWCPTWNSGYVSASMTKTGHWIYSIQYCPQAARTFELQVSYISNTLRCRATEKSPYAYYANQIEHVVSSKFPQNSNTSPSARCNQGKVAGCITEDRDARVSRKALTSLPPFKSEEDSCNGMTYDPDITPSTIASSPKGEINASESSDPFEIRERPPPNLFPERVAAEVDEKTGIASEFSLGSISSHDALTGENGNSTFASARSAISSCHPDNEPLPTDRFKESIPSFRVPRLNIPPCESSRNYCRSAEALVSWRNRVQQPNQHVCQDLEYKRWREEVAQCRRYYSHRSVLNSTSIEHISQRPNPASAPATYRSSNKLLSPK